MPRKPAKHKKREYLSKRGQKTFRRMESQDQAERTAMERQTQAKERGIKNPPDIMVLTSGERANLKSAKKRYKHETAMAEHYGRKGTFDKATTERVKKDVKATYEGAKREAKERSEKRKAARSSRYRSGVKAFRD